MAPIDSSSSFPNVVANVEITYFIMFVKDVANLTFCYTDDKFGIREKHCNSGLSQGK